MAAELLPSRYADPRQIGQGGMGEIYLVQDTVLGRKVVIKLLAERYSRDEALRRRFTREALAAAKLSGHPHIVTIFDVGEFDDRPFIVMEYLAGGTVGERARAGRIERGEAMSWLEGTATALDGAHEAGIVHRDVKPANLLLDERGTVHVCDFGIARIADESTAGMTAAGTVLGTAGYLAPEQARGEPATHASDVYGLGVVAYELLTGGRPFEGGSATEEAAAHIHQPVPPASERGVGLPREVDRVFERALAKEPNERYGSASELVRDLGIALEAGDQPTRVLTAPAPQAPAKPPRPVRRGEPAPRRRSYAPVILAGLLLAALATGGVLAAVVTGGDDDAPPETQAAEPSSERTITQVTTVQGETVTQESTVTTPAETSPTTTDSGSSGSGGGSGGGGGPKVSPEEAVALTDQATGLMGDGNYEDALPLALRAYRSLRGTGDIYEAYSAFNAGKSYIELGDCKKGLPLLDASEAIQGEREPISSARAQCG